MSQTQNTILVLGATGQQGGATVRHLLKGGWSVRALVRDPHKAAAQTLNRQGVELVRGDLNTTASLHAAMDGVYGVFSVQSYLEAGVEAEERQGKAVVDAAAEAGVSHLVYSSVGGAERNSGIAHFESKWHIENAIRERGLAATVLRPVFFMENLPLLTSEEPDGTVNIRMALRPTTALQMIAVDDIGAFAALAFREKARYLDKAIELAGDELTPGELTHVYQQVVGKPVRFTEVPLEQLRSFDPEMGAMFAWFNAEGYHADIPALRQLHPALQTFQTWLSPSVASLVPPAPNH